MSIHENIQFFYPVDPTAYLQVLINEYGAQSHPNQESAFLVDGLPFYAPQQADEHTFILSFNLVPLAPVLIQALIDHPQLAASDTQIRWTQEQHLVLEGTLEDLSSRFAEYGCGGG